MTNKKQEQNEQNIDQDPQLETKYAQATARIAQLEQENMGLRSLVLQLGDILQKTDEFATSVRYNIEHEKYIIAGVKLEALYRHVDSNNIALQSITKEWKKE